MLSSIYVFKKRIKTVKETELRLIYRKCIWQRTPCVSLRFAKQSKESVFRANSEKCEAASGPPC